MKKKLCVSFLVAMLAGSCVGQMPGAYALAAPVEAEAVSVAGDVSDGAAAEKYTGWKKEKKKTYYYKKGVMLKNKWIVVEGKKYHLSKSGKLDVKKWVGKRYVNKQGAWVKEAVKGKWEGSRYRKSNGKYLNNGEYYIDGYYYIFSNGVVQKNGWKLLNKVWYYCDSRGRVATNKWVKATFTTVATSDWWKTFDAAMPYKWVNEKGQFDARKSKTVKWDECLIVKRANSVPEGMVREGWYWIEAANKSKPAYYQWVQKTGNSTENYREINKVKGKVKVAFGEGEAKNPWCIQLKNCKLTRIE